MKPPAPALSGTAYVGGGSNAGAHALVQAYSLPLSTTSTALFTVATPATSENWFCDDSFGHLFVVDRNNGIDVYTLPLGSTSTPAFKLATSQQSQGECAADAAGNLYVPEDVYNNDPFNPQVQGYIDLFKGPVHAGSTRAKTIKMPPQTNGLLTGVFNATTDTAGDVFVDTGVASAGFSPKGRSVMRGQLIVSLSIAEFSSLQAGNSLLAMFGAGHNPKIGLDGNLYTLDATVIYPFTEIVDVYLPSDFHNGGAKDHAIALGMNVSPQDIAFDKMANMYVTADSGATPPTKPVVLMLPPPYAAIGVTMQQSSPVTFTGGIVIVP